MDAPLIRLPGYSRGLKLVRVGVFIMLAQLVLSVVMTVKAFGADSTDDAANAFKWIQYFLWANIGASVAMLIGSLLAVPDFRLARLPIYRGIVAIAGFAITTAALWWTHHVITTFMEVAFDPEADGEAVLAALEGLESLQVTVIIKDLAYVSGLIAVLRMVRQSAVANEQLALRDAASDLTGLLVIMLVGDAFYQLTYGLGGGVSMFPMLGILAAVLVLGFWIYCHIRLIRFLENAAYFVNEPHHVPTATVISRTTVGEAPRPSTRAMSAPLSAPRTSAPALPASTASAPLIVVAPVVAPAPVPRAETSDPAEPPRFLT